MTDSKAELLQRPSVLENQWVIAPDNFTEMPGLRKFIAISGHGTPEDFQVPAGAFSFKSILDGLLGRGTTDDFNKLIKLFKSHKTGSLDETLSQIKLTDISPGRAPEDTTLLEAVKLLEQDDNTKGVTEILRVLTEELGVRSDEDLNAQVKVDQPINPPQIARLAAALNIPEAELQDISLATMLQYLSTLSKRVDELADFSAAETSFLVTRERIPEVRMLDDVILQTGLDCVPYAMHNLIRAANNQGAEVAPVTLDEIKQWTPRAEGSGFRHMVSGRLLSDLLPSKGFTAHSDFSWGEAIKLIRERRGGLFLRINSSHAVAVVGIRHANTDLPQIEFLVANSLSGIGEKGRPYWVNAKELVSQTELLNTGIGQTERRDNFLITWKLPEGDRNINEVASQILIGTGVSQSEEPRVILEVVARQREKRPKRKKGSGKPSISKKGNVLKITKKDL